MARSKFSNGRLKSCIHKSEITEEMRLVEGSDTDYVTPSGKVYADYDNDMYFPKTVFENKRNHYWYTSINYKGKLKQRRIHVIIARAFIENPDPIKFKLVGHKNNNKSDNYVDNLYWTDNQENTQKAIDDGLNVSKKGIDNPASTYIKVIDKNTKEVVGVYGSISECARCIENISKSYIAQMCQKDFYIPRSRKYIYKKASIEDMNTYHDLLGVNLTESPASDKNPVRFFMINLSTGQKDFYDNQKAASKICGISQAEISHLLSCSYAERNGWGFERIDKTTYKNASSYQNFIKHQNDVVIKNIFTGEERIFKTKKELSDEFNLSGHDLLHYIRTGHTLMNEWKMISG